MRARYAAYALGLARFIVATTVVGGRAYEHDKQRWLAAVGAFCRQTRFEALDIVQRRIEGAEAWVTFVASLRRGDERHTMAEESYFVHSAGRWFYEGGRTPTTSA